MADYLPRRQNLKVQSTVELFNLNLNAALSISSNENAAFVKFHISSV